MGNNSSRSANEEEKKTSENKKHELVKTVSSSVSNSNLKIVLETTTERNDLLTERLLNTLLHKIFLFLNKDGYFSIQTPSHEGIKCKVCKKFGFAIDRYKCLKCKDFNLCGECFEARKSIEPHVKGHPMIRYTGPNEIFGDYVENDSVTYEKIKEQFGGMTHEAISCNGCNSEQLVGLRLKCDDCNNFDLCSTCFEKNVEINDHKSDHFMLVYYGVQNVNPLDIEFLEKLGSGAFGTVHKAKLISKNKIVACKVFEYNIVHQILGFNIGELYQSFIRELLAYNEFNSNYIIKTYGSCIVNDNDNCKFYLLTEFMDNGSLAALLNKEPDLSYRCRLSMACNIASGMKRIHEKNFIHRDIRPDNIFVSKDYVAKIGDMGIARLQDQFEQHSIIGPRPYMPNEFYTGKYNEKLDVFTFGLTLYHLFTGSSHSFINGKIELVKKPIVFGEVIEKCLQDDPSKRPTASSLENWLTIYKECFWDSICNLEEYPQLSMEDRTLLFLKSYNSVTEMLQIKFV